MLVIDHFYNFIRNSFKSRYELNLNLTAYAAIVDIPKAAVTKVMGMLPA